jgi:hypothetical protein
MRISAKNADLYALKHGIIDLNRRKALLQKALRRPLDVSMPVSGEGVRPTLFFYWKVKIFCSAAEFGRRTMTKMRQHFNPYKKSNSHRSPHECNNVRS